MKQIYKISDLKAEIAQLKSEGKSIGFVPTMGALHGGHLSLVERSLSENDITIVSIFVNPTQFNNPNDLKNYPRTLAQDYEILLNAGCDIVFSPSVEEMYPEPDLREFNFGNIENVMEGRFRSGHFSGVAQIVSKLFDAVTPHRAYFGEKDFQQVAIIRKMVEMLRFDVEIISCPIVREENGLAKSSRNELLTPEERKKAALISKTLIESTNFVAEKDIEAVKKQVVEQIDKEPALKVEYFEIVDGNSLLPVSNWKEVPYVVGCIAVFCGKVRLIDNVVYSK